MPGLPAPSRRQRHAAARPSRLQHLPPNLRLVPPPPQKPVVITRKPGRNVSRDHRSLDDQRPRPTHRVQELHAPGPNARRPNTGSSSSPDAAPGGPGRGASTHPGSPGGTGSPVGPGSPIGTGSTGGGGSTGSPGTGDHLHPPTPHQHPSSDVLFE